MDGCCTQINIGLPTFFAQDSQALSDEKSSFMGLFGADVPFTKEYFYL